MTTIVVQGATSADDVPGIAALAEGPGIAALAEGPGEPEVELRFSMTVGELRAALPGADVLLGWDFAAGGLEEAWDAAGDLRWIQWCGAGVNAALFPGLAHSDVVLTNARGIFDRAMAEYVLGLIIAFAKRFHESYDLQIRSEWRHRLSERIEGAKVLVVGVGSIGREIARTLRAVGMRVEGVGRTARGGDQDFEKIHGTNGLIDCLGDADYVVLITPLTSETAGLFGARAFAAMKPSARFINLGRGQLVQEAELIAALDAGHLAGAALDVFETEPLPSESPLWRHPGIIVTPHNSGDFIGYEDALAALFLDNFARYRAGQPLRNLVDKALGFAAP